jgi:hypothetical protein
VVQPFGFDLNFTDSGPIGEGNSLEVTAQQWWWIPCVMETSFYNRFSGFIHKLYRNVHQTARKLTVTWFSQRRGFTKYVGVVTPARLQCLRVESVAVLMFRRRSGSELTRIGFALRSLAAPPGTTHQHHPPRFLGF